MKSKGKKKGYIGIAITAILLIVTVVADLLVSRYITMIKLYFMDDSNSVYEMSADEALSQAADLTRYRIAKEQGQCFSATGSRNED